MDGLEWIVKEGWTVRKRTIKGRDYMIARKNGKDKSIGPYDEETWNRLVKLGAVKPKLSSQEIQGLKNILTTFNDTIANLKAELKEVKSREVPSQTAELKASQCPSAQSWYNRVYCSNYSWERKPSKIMEMFPNVDFHPSRMSKGRKWRFTPHPDICGNCTKFLEEPHAQEIIERVVKDFEQVSASAKLLKESARRRVRDDYNGCVYMGKDEYCIGWSYSSRLSDRDQKRYTYDGKTVYYNNVKKHPEICASCPSYKARGSK